MTHSKPCKFCGIPLTVESSHDCPADWSNVILGLLACNRCADYRSSMIRLNDSIRRTCQTFIQMHNAGAMNEETTTALRQTLGTLTKRVADAVCRFYRVALIWEPDFIQQLIDQPDKHTRVISTYTRLVRESAKGKP